MKIHEIISENIIMEVPLPSDWDKEVYKPDVSYKKRIDYAVARAQKLGTGSSRVAFTIDYEGRPTVLKVAKNKKGMAQNEAEASLLEDGYLSSTGLMIPLIDYDEEHQQPVWIHTEKANKATEKQLCNIIKCPSLHDLVQASIYAYTGRSVFGNALENANKKVIEKYGEDALETFHEWVDKLQEFQQYDINIGDFARAANWGLYNNEPIIIDVGFTNAVHSEYYK